LNNGESSFMTDHYDEAGASPASLTKQNDARSTMRSSTQEQTRCP
jgi:hypothetical protein